MYCKFCGNSLENGVSRCNKCGSAIYYKDGGQSFFTEEELSAWQAGPKMQATGFAEVSQPPFNNNRPYPSKHSNSDEVFFTPKMIAFTVGVLLLVILLIGMIVMQYGNKGNSDISGSGILGNIETWNFVEENGEKTEFQVYKQEEAYLYSLEDVLKQAGYEKAEKAPLEANQYIIEGKSLKIKAAEKEEKVDLTECIEEQSEHFIPKDKVDELCDKIGYSFSLDETKQKAELKKETKEK